MPQLPDPGPPFRFSFEPYQYEFTQPLITAHGLWRVRAGILVCLEDAAGRQGWGEIAPVPWFGSETLEEARDFCRQLSPRLDQTTIWGIPASLPACQFGLESALTALHQPPQVPPLRYCGLLPTGVAALGVLPTLAYYSTLKWKIGVEPLAQELAVFARLIRVMAPGTQLRLDANGSLTRETARVWLQACQGQPVEFLEQPLQDFQTMQRLAEEFATPLALDESVASLGRLESCHRQGWRGVMVVKPAIIGSPRQLKRLCQTYRLDVVFSSVFETPVGRRAALALAGELGGGRAVGYGLDHWLNPGYHTEEG